jgi:hypothetical protein
MAASSSACVIARHFRLIAHQAATQAQDAAGAVAIFSVEIGGDLLVRGIFQPEKGERVGGKEGLHLLLLDGEVEQIARIGAPADVGVRIDAEFCELDREEILVGASEIADGDHLAPEVGERVHA